MDQNLKNEIYQYVENNIGDFHNRRLRNLETLNLKKVIKRKNPYLFRAKNILTASEFVQSILDAHISSNEETIFGEFLEGLAIFVNNKVYKGWKSSTTGIDLEFESNNMRYLVSIKSGPNWGNSEQIKKLRDSFRKAKITVRTSNSAVNVVAVNGCCYGKNKNYDKGEYFKYCGQKFWEFISGNEDMYVEIIEPLGYRAKEKNEEFVKAYSKLINIFTKDFIEEFCNDGILNWGKIVRHNSQDH